MRYSDAPARPSLARDEVPGADVFVASEVFLGWDLTSSWGWGGQTS